jgi:hypothetical protein
MVPTEKRGHKKHARVFQRHMLVLAVHDADRRAVHVQRFVLNFNVCARTNIISCASAAYAPL